MGTELGLKTRMSASRLRSGHCLPRASLPTLVPFVPILPSTPSSFPQPPSEDQTLRLSIEIASWSSLVVQWLGLGVFTAEPQVRFLFEELKSKKLHGTAKK